MQFVFIFPGICNANKPFGRCLNDCPNKQTKKLDWITFPHSVAQAISDFARRCYKPYESLMSRRRKKAFFNVFLAEELVGLAASSAAEGSDLRPLSSPRPLGTVWSSCSYKPASDRSDSPESLCLRWVSSAVFVTSLSCRPSFQHHLRPSPSI